MFKQLLIAFFLFSILGLLSCGQQKSEDEKAVNDTHHEMKMESKSDNPIVREGVIDLASIDVNKDGKVYQDQMCWNVVSDEAGDCPLCGMVLKEVSLDKAKENLLANDFEVKED